MKIPKFSPKKKLQATARRIPQRVIEDYEDEPSMNLSSAFIVVLLLHIVAIGGMYAFSKIKEHRAEIEPSRATKTAPAIVKSNVETGPPAIEHTAIIAPHSSPAKPATKPLDAPKSSGAKDSGQTYVVAKGDNPVTIAKKLGVPQDELLKLNKIDDPKKLQIGQKLKVPVKNRML